MDVVKDQNKIIYLFYEYNPLTKQKDNHIGEIIIEKVLNEFGIRLEWEIQILGQNG